MSREKEGKERGRSWRINHLATNESGVAGAGKGVNANRDNSSVRSLSRSRAWFNGTTIAVSRSARALMHC